jgi:predicted NBD/HSP70 family sugar kinase
MTAGTDRLRRDNTGRVLRTLRRRGPATRAELAHRTGLAKATIGAIVGDLVAGGAVTEADESTRQGARGRPGRPVSLRKEAFLGLGLELNVDYVSGVVVDLSGELLVSETRAVSAPGRPGPTPDTILLQLAEGLRDRFAGARARFVGATVAVPALVREDDRTIAWAPNVQLRGSHLASRLEALLPGCPVRVSNDANCAAYAEAQHGAAIGVRHAIYLTGTVGIGAGIIENGELVQGAAGFAGEVGHMPVGNPDARCGCGRLGCWEASIGLHALLAAVGMPELDTPIETAQAVAARAAVDPGTREQLARVGRDVGLGLATLAGVLDPEVVVLGGYFVPLAELILGPAREVLDARLASSVQVRPELRLSTLGIGAAARGAAEQSLTAALDGDLELSPWTPALT